jgi:hypothetical protein
VLDVALIIRISDDVGRVAEVAANAANQVLVGFAERVDRALARSLRA